MQGNIEHVLPLYGGKETYIRCFFGEAISRVGPCWAAGLGVLGRSTGLGVRFLRFGSVPEPSWIWVPSCGFQSFWVQRLHLLALQHSGFCILLLPVPAGLLCAGFRA